MNEKDLKRDYIIGDNAFIVHGTITLPDYKSQDELWDEFLKWLEEKNAFFFGYTKSIETYEEKEKLINKIFKEDSEINLDEE